MRILQINCVYNHGSTGKIVYDVHTELKKQGIESLVCYGRGPSVNDPHVYKSCSEFSAKINSLWARVSGIMYGSIINTTQGVINIIEKQEPDVVHLHCINAFFVNIYKLIEYLKINKIKTVLTLHAEFIHTANCGYSFDCESITP